MVLLLVALDTTDTITIGAISTITISKSIGLIKILRASHCHVHLCSCMNQTSCVLVNFDYDQDSSVCCSHDHLVCNAQFILLISLIPRSPTSIYSQPSLHATTQWPRFVSQRPFEKKLHCFLSIALQYSPSWAYL